MKEHVEKQNQPQQQGSTDAARSVAEPLAANQTQEQVLYLQRTIGNQAVLRLFGMNTAGGVADSKPSVTGIPAPGQEGVSQLIQRKASGEGNSVSESNSVASNNSTALSTESAGPEDSKQASAAEGEPKKLRVADVRYDAQGQPLDTKLSAAEQKRLAELLAKLQNDDPKFYAEIENEDLVVTVGSLPEGNVGKNLLSSRKENPLIHSKMRWFLFDKSGEDPSKGPPSPPTDAWLAAFKLFTETYSETEQKKMKDEKETRLDVKYSGVLILDLAQIDEQQKVYEKEYEAYKNKSFDTPGAKPEKPQSAMGTLRHEAGHLIFEKAFAFDKLGDFNPSKPLPETMKSQVATGSHSKNIKTEVALLSEYAAESVDDPLTGKPDKEEKYEPFDREKFMEENDPKFGVAGYHDLDGKEQTPTGFGVRLAENLTLVAAKKTAGNLKAALNVPVFLLTVLKPKTEQRLFNLFILEGAEKESVREQLDKLKTAPELANYKDKPVVAY
ncbi:MAG TPA: hypothetical protein VJS44_11160 [Pyrinomonadaceae bacterium]|nr:hypothetical protein [Pyrinomonadaceae bacterium]